MYCIALVLCLPERTCKLPSFVADSYGTDELPSSDWTSYGCTGDDRLDDGATFTNIACSTKAKLNTQPSACGGKFSLITCSLKYFSPVEIF